MEYCTQAFSKGSGGCFEFLLAPGAVAVSDLRVLETARGCLSSFLYPKTLSLKSLKLAGVC